MEREERGRPKGFYGGRGLVVPLRCPAFAATSARSASWASNSAAASAEKRLDVTCAHIRGIYRAVGSMEALWHIAALTDPSGDACMPTLGDPSLLVPLHPWIVNLWISRVFCSVAREWLLRRSRLPVGTLPVPLAVKL
mgnify:CR=1 FL=1